MRIHFRIHHWIHLRIHVSIRIHLRIYLRIQLRIHISLGIHTRTYLRKWVGHTPQSTLSAQVEHVSTLVAKKAIWLVLHQKTHVWCMKEKDEETGKESFVYYVLGEDNELGEKKLSNELITKYECTLRGEKPAYLRSLEKLLGICSCMHKIRTVQEDDKWKVPESPWNPGKLDCFSCKGFKRTGICSHSLAVNHILGHIDLVYNLKKFVIDANKKNKAGNSQKVMPALVRERPEKEGEEVDGITGPLRDVLRHIEAIEEEKGEEGEEGE